MPHSPAERAALIKAQNDLIAEQTARFASQSDANASRRPAGPAAIVCPHCQTLGSVTTRVVKRKSGVSGGKATGAVLTAGWSLLATGLSRKEKVTEMRCGNCGVTWSV